MGTNSGRKVANMWVDVKVRRFAGEYRHGLLRPVAAFQVSGCSESRVERVKAESTARTLHAEVTELRVEGRQELERVTAWVERATRAEAWLEELAKSAEGQGHRS
jgi:outer membrane murein-binding lipoprotein Lpp